MGETTTIEWCDHTFNPWIGCAKVSAGCKHCYAESLMDTRWQKVRWGEGGTRTVTSDSYWRLPARWDREAQAGGAPSVHDDPTPGRRPRVFCASLADVFEDRSDLVEPRTRLLKLIALTPHLDWLLLTKRPERIEPLLLQSLDPDPPLGTDSVLLTAGRPVHEWQWRNIPRNIWFGTSAEDQATLNERAPIIARTAGVRFLSLEPLLGPINLLDPEARLAISSTGDGPGIDWVIVGGESGHGARPCDVDWIRRIIRDCRRLAIPVFVKQLGLHSVDRTSHISLRHPKGGDPTEWPPGLHIRRFPLLRPRR